MYDIIAIDKVTNVLRVLGENKSEENADAIVAMAISRIGSDEEIFVKTLAGQYKDNDIYK